MHKQLLEHPRALPSDLFFMLQAMPAKRCFNLDELDIPAQVQEKVAECEQGKPDDLVEFRSTLAYPNFLRMNFHLMQQLLDVLHDLEQGITKPQSNLLWHEIANRLKGYRDYWTDEPRPVLREDGRKLIDGANRVSWLLFTGKPCWVQYGRESVGC